MCQATEASAASLRDEGAAYMAALLQAMQAGRAGAVELSSLVQFLAGGEMLAGACAELCQALRKEATS
jgi:hypothetical protein